MRAPDGLALLALFALGCGGGPTATVEPAEIHPARVLTAIVEPVDGVAHVAVSHTSTVIALRARVGDRVEAGATLADLALSAGSALLDDEEPLRATIAGTVVAVHCARGDTVAPGTVAFELASLDRVVARAEVEPSALEGVPVPTSVAVRDGSRRAEGTLERLPIVRARDGALDVSPRLLVEVPLDARAGWVPFSEVELRVSAPPVSAAASVPRDAIRFVDGEAIVELPGLLGPTPRVVHLGASDDARVEITEGLEPGTTVCLASGGES